MKQSEYLTQDNGQSSADNQAANRAIDFRDCMTAGQLAQAAYTASISPGVTRETSAMLATAAARAYAAKTS